MKKIKVSFAIFCIAIIFISSCQKDKTLVNSISNKTKSNSTAFKIGGLKTSGFEGSYMLSSLIGHNVSVCNGKCIYINGTYYHVNCQGYGSTCNISAHVSITKAQPNNDSDPYYIGIVDNTDEPSTDSIFNMPSRSFYIENTEYENGYIWLNVPEQILLRDEFTHKFIYYYITFTTEQVYENL